MSEKIKKTKIKFNLKNLIILVFILAVIDVIADKTIGFGGLIFWILFIIIFAIRSKYFVEQVAEK